MNILVIDNGTSYLEQLKQLLAGHTIELVTWHKDNFDMQKQYDFVILSGGHGHPIISTKQPEYFSEEIAYIQHTQNPILGICLGAELIAYAFGGTLEKKALREEGTLAIEIMNNDPLVSGVENVSVFESHRWVIKELPSKLIGIAKSKDGYEIIKHITKPTYGFQFHPEMLLDKTGGATLFRNLLRIIEERRDIYA